ncbi:MAG: efflux RND transporter periplasmic adaptor subunit [Blastocatellales bacterium]
MSKRLLTIILAATFTACGAAPKDAGKSGPPSIPDVTVTRIQSHELERELRLPGELRAWQDVALHARVQGFVESISVDRGSKVRRGQVIAVLRAPEMENQRREAEAKAAAASSQLTEARARLAAIRSQRLEAEARLSTDEATYRRMKSASATPGVVAGNDLDVAAGSVEAGKARVDLYRENEKAAQAQVDALIESERALREAAGSVRNIESYLRITAPFDGTITERNAHPGDLASPAGPPLARIQMLSQLRLLVAVPEAEISGVRLGSAVPFTLPAFPGENFSGILRRSSGALEPRTRTMPVELDVANPSGRLAPGMMPELQWPTRRARPSLFVPPTAVATTTERSFVIRISNGNAEWVDVKRGAPMKIDDKDLVEVFGDLAEGDTIAVRATDELRDGSRVNVRPPSK